MHIQICFGEIDQYNILNRETGPEPAELVEFKVTVIDEKGNQTLVRISPKTDCWEGTFIPQQKGVICNQSKWTLDNLSLCSQEN